MSDLEARIFNSADTISLGLGIQRINFISSDLDGLLGQINQ